MNQTNWKQNKKKLAGYKLKIPVIPVASKEVLKHLYLWVIARYTAKKYHSGSYLLLKELRKSLCEMGYKQPDHLLSEVFKNPIGLFNLSQKTNRIYLRSPANVIKLIFDYENGIDPSRFDDFPRARLTSYIWTYITKAPFKIYDFRRAYTELLASRPSENAQIRGPVVEITNKKTKNKKKIADPKHINCFRLDKSAQLIDSFPGGRTYRSIGDESLTTRITSLKHLQKNKTCKIRRQKTMTVMVLDCNNHYLTLSWKMFKQSIQKQSLPFVLVVVTVPFNTDIKKVAEKYRSLNIIFVRERQNITFADSNEVNSIKSKLAFTESCFNVPFVMEHTIVPINVWKEGKTKRFKATKITFKRDCANIYAVNNAFIDDAYVVVNPSNLTMTTPDNSKVHIRKNQLTLELKVNGLMSRTHIRRMENWERKLAKSQILYSEQIKSNKLIFKAKRIYELTELKLPPIITKQNKPPKPRNVKLYEK